MKNELARDVIRAQEKIQYDTQCKKVLANKTILAWILKYTVEEFKDMEIPEIRDCIEGEPEISSVRVEPGETNRIKTEPKPDVSDLKLNTATSQRESIIGLSNEDKVQDEGEIYFDIRFSVRLPMKSEGEQRQQIKLLVNLEIQKDFYPGYDIVTRGIFYVARLISSQLGTEIFHSRYNDLKKVYSIWICMDAPQKIGNAISKFSFTKEDLIPGIPDKQSAYDKMTVVQICLGKDSENKAVNENDFKKDFGESQLLEMLNTLFDPGMNPQKKLEKLENDYHIPMENKLGEELNQMCNLSDYVEEIGIQKGLKQGLEQGLAQGLEQGLEQGLSQGLEQGLEQGLTAGLKQGRILNLIELIQKKYQKNKSILTIADEVEEDIHFIEKLYVLVKNNPDKSAEEIYQMM